MNPALHASLFCWLWLKSARFLVKITSSYDRTPNESIIPLPRIGNDSRFRRLRRRPFPPRKRRCSCRKEPERSLGSERRLARQERARYREARKRQSCFGTAMQRSFSCSFSLRRKRPLKRKKQTRNPSCRKRPLSVPPDTACGKHAG